MKVLHVIPSLSPALGGPPQVAIQLVYALRQLGVEAEIVTTDHDGADSLDVPLAQRTDYSPDGQISVPVWFLPCNRPALKEFIFSAPLTGWLWNHLDNYDVLDHHYLFSYAPSCASTMARIKGIPYTVRTMGQLTPWALEQSQAKKRLYTALIERQNLNAASAIHCTTAAEAEDVRNFGISTPTVTLPLGVGISAQMDKPTAQAKLRARYRISADSPIVLFLSRLHYKKRPDLLLDALSQQRHSFYAILAGSGEPAYVEQLKQQAVNLGIADRVCFTGLVGGEDKELLLQGSDLFALPSFSENFGIAVAEALSAGLPVVITEGVQIAPEISAAEAGLVVPSEAAAFTAALAQLLDSAQLRQQLGQNGKQLAAQRYNWQTIARQLLPVYAEIAAQKHLRCSMQA